MTDALVKFGILVNTQCVFCRQEFESLDHLFFQCPYDYTVLNRIFSYGGWFNPPTLMEPISKMIQAQTGIKITKLIMNLS